MRIPGVERSLRIPRLSEPPREIPLGLRLKILLPYEVTGTLLYTVPASFFLLGAASGGKMPVTITLSAIGTFLLLLALQSALPALLRAAATLRRMRNGFLTVGQVVSCRLPWQRARVATPYPGFLEEWRLNLGRAQMAKVSGCLVQLVSWIFFAPFLLIVIGGLTAVILAALKVPGGAEMARDVDPDYMVRFALAAIVMVFGALMVMRLIPRIDLTKAEKTYAEWRKKVGPRPDGASESHARQLLEEARQSELKAARLKRLPKDSASAIQLICKVDYSVMNERCIATGRARLCDRLQPSGVELVLFDPRRRDRVDLLVGLPREVEVGPTGEWKRIPWLRAAILATVAFGIPAFAILALAVSLQSIRAAAGP